MIDPKKALAHRWFEEVWNQGREATIDELFVTHGVAFGLGESDTDVHGPAEFKPFWRNLRNAFPDLRIRIEDTIAEDDKVVVRIVFEGTHGGEGIGVPPSGQEVRVNGLCVLQVANGKIVTGWNLWDQLGMLRQVGAIPSPNEDRFLTGRP